MSWFKYVASLALLSVGLAPGHAAIRIAIAGISHESNSFNLTKATLADFEEADALSGNRKQWLETTTKSNVNASGMIAGAAKYGVELYPIHFFSAVPRGPVDDRGFDSMVSRIIQGLVKPPMMLNLIHHDTYRPPLKAIVDASKATEKLPGVRHVSIPGGYQHGDVPSMGPSVIVITDNDPALAKREAERLGALLWGIRDQLIFDLPDPAKAVRMAMEGTKFPVTLLDTGDNVGGGSAGDSTFMLAELVKQKAEGWVMAI